MSQGGGEETPHENPLSPYTENSNILKKHLVFSEDTIYKSAFYYCLKYAAIKCPSFYK